MDSLDKIQSGDIQGIRKNEASIWAANDILRRGSQYKPYGASAAGVPGQGYVKIPPDVQDNLEADAMRIQKMKMELN